MLLYTGQTVQNVSEDQCAFLVDIEFTRPKIIELLEIEKKMEMLMSMFRVNFFGFFTRTYFSRLLP